MHSQLHDTGTFSTTHASRYLQQLCKHFGHKTEVQYDETAGTISLLMGPAQLRATDVQLEAVISAADPEGLSKARHIIDKHLERFAFREGFKAMDWQGPLPE
ncbi:DUF2218 domain-containing protein [Sagittula sp. NFXS13]|uniref:DUF2218 domain-containing protein n=1 Tax=Sagittula sp. NFXS13 TaxID=2819095 RepID=UPI0032DF4AA5